MQKTFKFSLTGKGWFLLFLFVYVIIAAMICLAAYIGVNTVEGNTPGVSVIIPAAGVFVIVILAIIGWVIPFYRKFINNIAFDNKQFSFHGNIPSFIGMNLLGIFLTIITLTIYMPWYIRRIMNHILTNIEYDGKRPEFNGNGGKLFVTMLWAFYIPVVIIAALSAFFREYSTAVNYRVFNQVLSQILFIPFMYKIYQWMFDNTSWNGLNTRWNTEFWPSVGFMLGQALLTLITVFIYWPAAFVRIYSYFASLTQIQGNGQTKGHFEFKGKAGSGFLLIWGQVLLTIITLGFYLPWGMVRVYKWFIEETVYIS